MVFNGEKIIFFEIKNKYKQIAFLFQLILFFFQFLLHFHYRFFVSDLFEILFSWNFLIQFHCFIVFHVNGDVIFRGAFLDAGQWNWLFIKMKKKKRRFFFFFTWRLIIQGSSMLQRNIFKQISVQFCHFAFSPIY